MEIYLKRVNFAVNLRNSFEIRAFNTSRLDRVGDVKAKAMKINDLTGTARTWKISLNTTPLQRLQQLI